MLQLFDMKNPWIIIGVLVVVLIGGSVWYSGSVEEKNNVGIDTEISHIKGNPDADVKLVEYSDFQCPACASYEPILQKIFEDFGDDISFEYKHFPLMTIHPLAEPAARASEAAAQQDAFFAYHDLLFENQATWSKSPNPTALFEQYAEDLDLDVDTFKRHMQSSLLRDKVRESFNEARDLGLSGTPSFLLNGEEMNITTLQDLYSQVEAAVGTGTVSFEL